MTFPKRIALPLLFLAAASVVAVSARAAEASQPPDDAQVNAIVRKLESSGALDAAVDRAIERYVKRQERAREAQEEQRLGELAKHIRPVDPKRDHVRGPAGAQISLIEFTDFECPFCKHFHETPKALLERYGSRLDWVIRNFPLPIHEPAARKEALAAECVARLAGNDAYWRYADAVFANTRSNGAGLPPGHSIEKLAAQLGVNAAPLEKCLKDPKIAAQVDTDIAEGAAAGIQGTPTTLVRDNRSGATRVIIGARPPTDVSRAIDELLAGRK